MNVLITSTTFIPSVLLCGHSQLEYLEKQGKLNYKFVISFSTNKKNIEWADIIVFLRSDSDIDVYVSKIAKKANKKLIYVLDDDILNVPSYLSSAPYYLLPSTQKNIRKIMNNCDTFLTPSPVLLEKYGNNFKYKFLISEPSLNRIGKKQENDKVKIGFAGSIDRAQDLNEILEDTITEIVKKYGKSIDVEIMGAKPEFVDKLHLKHLPYQDGYDTYTAFMAKCNWDIGLAPMPDTKFHKCKYFNKYVEYASFGIAGIYSNLEPYTYGIKDKVNGLLVNNTTKDWVKAISTLIDNEKLRKKISNKCIQEANEIYALDILAEDFLDKITYNYVKSEKETKIPSLSLIKFLIFFKRVFRKAKEQGLNFPSWLMKRISNKLNDYKKYRKDFKNKKRIKQIIKNNKTIFVFAPMFDDSKDEYNKRVKFVDEAFDDYFKIYFSGENRIDKHIEVDFIDENHATIICNSFDIQQSKEILEIISKCKNVLIHSVIRFMRDKISNDLYKIFELDNVKVYWDSHGKVPEEYHKASNFHTEAITNDIEKVFYEKSDVLIVENNILKKHFIDKYGKGTIKFVVLTENINELNKL